MEVELIDILLKDILIYLFKSAPSLKFNTLVKFIFPWSVFSIIKFVMLFTFTVDRLVVEPLNLLNAIIFTVSKLLFPVLFAWSMQLMLQL